ncbi:MAG: DUF349 domain-containing protein [Massilia sp.]
MLKFLFKRPGDKPAETPGPSAAEEQKAAATASTKAERSAQAERLAAISSASGGEREAAAADFILQCDFSELRLAAAEFITSRAQLERLHGAIRNTDRRVAKLLQGRLDAIRHHDAEMARAEACLAQARSLLADEKLTPNHVAELDRRWSVIAAPELADAFAAVRTQLGARLEAQVGLQRAMIDRLAALRKLAAGDAGDAGDADPGAALARMSAEQKAALSGPEHASLPRQLVAEFAAEEGRVQASMAVLEQGRAALAARSAALDGWTAAMAQPPAPAATPETASPEAATAPAEAVVDTAPAAELSDAPLASAETPAVDASSTQPIEAEPTAPAPAMLAEPTPPTAPPLDAAALRREWQRLPKPPAGDAADALQERFEQLLSRLPGDAKARGGAGERPARAAVSPARDEGGNAKPHAKPGAGQQPGRERSRPVGGADSAFLDELAAMESALEQGSLHSAADHDKALKDSKGGKLSPAQADRLAHARAELKRLSDWARWGGNVSREELIKAVEQLSTQSLPMAELAKKVGSMRERWKALDTLSGAAPKSLWERFDAACTAAYAPAAAHFKQLAEERHSNSAKAQALIDEAQAQAGRIVRSNEADANPDSSDGSLEAAVDWKQMAATVQRLRLAWSHLGAIDRKDKKRLDQQFSDALNIMQKPLEQQRKAEVGHREALIDQVSALDPLERGALDALRAAQERWQELARALPLERKAEQAMWHRFRAACDAVFARRKETANAADAERRAHQAAKDAISARLEQAASDMSDSKAGSKPDANAARSLLREAASEWHAIGAVPRAQEAKVEQRYHAAVAAIEAKIDAVKRAADVAQASALRDKLRLCQQLESALADSQADAENATAEPYKSRWAALPPLPGAWERALKTRFDAALAVLDGSADRAAYLRKLEANRPILLQEVLRQEIAAGIDSGSEFARDRLKLQVEVLQSSLKSGQKQGADGDAARFEQLAAMPALVDERTAHRIEQLFARARKGVR